jgi:hypothetical protein
MQNRTQQHQTRIKFSMGKWLNSMGSRPYNTERLHQSLSYRTPEDVYASAVGGGAMIVEKFVELGQRHSAA